MTLHPLAARFAEVADLYERGRPDYPRAVADALAAELALPAGAPVLDLGAGTGKLTRALAAAGLDVIAVEPQEPMRAILAASVGAERVLAGTAEAIPLREHSVYAVTVADAFHWFDTAPALTEIRRVLRPRGGLAVLSTTPDLADASWAHEVGELFAQSRAAHPLQEGFRWQDAVRENGGFSEPCESSISISQPVSVERLLDWVASFSWVAAIPRARREKLLARVRQLMLDGHTPDELAVLFTIGTVRAL